MDVTSKAIPDYSAALALLFGLKSTQILSSRAGGRSKATSDNRRGEIAAHTEFLFATRRHDEAWSCPLRLTSFPRIEIVKRSLFYEPVQRRPTRRHNVEVEHLMDGRL